MKKILMALLLAWPVSAYATPYFRIFDVAHPQPIAGALFGTDNLKDTRGGGLVPLITHSQKDGYIIIPNEDWSPLAVGASAEAGKWTFDVGPIFNVLPWMQEAALELIPDKFESIRNVIAPTPGNAVTFSAGPIWQYQQATNKGYYKTFTGLALHF